jgi:hypothetical protein
VASQFGDKAVEHHGRVAELIRESPPVYVAGFPGLAEETAGVASKEGEGFYVQKLAAIGAGECGVRNAKVLRYAVQAGFSRILAAELV